jgi:DNA-binding NtrC family response regulator
VIPPLKERKDDIPDLLDHFIRYYSKEYGKPITGISPNVLNEMLNYPWPGNVRELEHFIERSILLSKGSEITEIILPKQPGNQNVPETVTGRMKTIDENERDYILSVLKNCNGRIRGAGGAAEVMGLPPTTLHSKMKRLGIK